ncbi:MAG: OmpA family protein [Bacteroidia bacterium]
MRKFNLFLVVFILCINQLFAQSKRDSSNAEIKQQALEMREKLSKYLADNLLEEQIKKDTGIQYVVDSLSNIVSKQQMEINALNEKLNSIAKLVQLGEFDKHGASSAINQNMMVREVVKGKTHHIVSQTQLNLYFQFDSFKLSKEQKLILKNFIKTKKAKSIIVAGYTDWLGSEQYNKSLAASRSNSVKSELDNLGIKIEIQSNNICNNNSVYNDHTAKWCRRVEIMIR